MSKINDGGLAFPFQVSNGPDMHEPSYGMSLRDWFAGQALSGIAGSVCSDGSDFIHAGGPAVAARWAYSFADAMLAVREGGAK